MKVKRQQKEDDATDEEPEKRVRMKRTFERGWTGKTWPGRKVGRPVTANGG